MGQPAALDAVRRCGPPWLIAGLHRRGRKVLISAVTTAVAGAVIALLLRTVIAEGDWLVILLVTLGLIAVGLLAGWRRGRLDGFLMAVGDVQLAIPVVLLLIVLVAALGSAGVRIVSDTCTYISPVMDEVDGPVMTDSGKWAWYAPANLGVEAVIGGLEECVRSAIEGRVVRDETLWADD